MNKLPVAVQLYSVRDDAEKDFAGTLRQIKEMGYDGVELAGLYNLTPEKVKEIADENGLQVLSAHVPIQELLADMEGTIDKYVAAGCSYIAIPYLPPELRPDAPDFDKVLEKIDAIGVMCNQKGVTLLYHNHDFEFVKMPDGSFGLDYIYSTIPADRLQTELDICWVKVAGQDPAAYIEKYASRCPVVHLKDFFKQGNPTDLYGLLGINEPGQGGDEKKDVFEFRPVGHGLQDIPSVLVASLKSGASWVVVEQDMSVGRPALEAIKMSREYLKALGW